MKTPVVMLLFNRPGLTRRNLAAIRRVAPEQLFVVADGPREGNPDDAVKCAQVREVIGEVDWPCDVRTRFAEKNLGLDPNIETGLDWVFSQVDRAIILEDDCIAEPTFFAYCEELLDRYADEKSVWQIAGDTHEVPEELFGDDGAPVPEIRDYHPEGERRMSAKPHANGGLLLTDLRLPDFREYGVEVKRPGTGAVEATRVLGTWLRDVMAQNMETFRLVSPDENNSNRLQDVLDATDRTWGMATVPYDDQIM